MRCTELAIITTYPTSHSEWNNNYCFIKNNQEILLDLANFALQEQPKDSLKVSINRAWYNIGSYTVAA